MSTESRIEARDAKAAGGVVAEAEWLRRLRIAAKLLVLTPAAAMAASQVYKDRGLAVFGQDIARALDALTAAQAREVGLREALNAANERAERLQHFVAFVARSAAECRRDALTDEEFRSIVTNHPIISAPTPEAPDHD